MTTKINFCPDPDLEIIKNIIKSKKSNENYTAPKGFWCKQTAIKAVRYVILDYFNFTREEVCKEFSLIKLDNLGLRSARKFGNIYELISNAVPEFYIYPWELKKIPNDFWNVDNTKEAINWLIYEVLNTTPTNLKLTPTLLNENGLGRVYKKYGHNIKKIIEIVFPENYFGKL